MCLCKAGPAQQDAAYLGVRLVVVSHLLFQILADENLVPSVHELWKSRAQHVLALPAAATVMGPEEQRLMQIWENELIHVFHPTVKLGEVLFKIFPAGNERLLISLPSHYVIDVGLLPINNVHALLAKDGERSV